jgi:protein ImuA
MSESLALLTRLRVLAAAQTRAVPTALADAWLANGLQRGQVHELFAGENDGHAGAAGFAISLALAADAAPLLWLRTVAAERNGGRLHATGLLELGLDPDRLVLAVVADEAALLRAAADAARCPGLGTVLVETWGRAPGLDLTATRRLQLAAEASGVTVVLLRVDAVPAPSAAATRWQVSACPSAALASDAPGGPVFLVELQRRRGGPAGQRWRVEWNRDGKSFDATALSGADLSLAVDRTAALDPSAPLRRTG